MNKTPGGHGISREHMHSICWGLPDSPVPVFVGYGTLSVGPNVHSKSNTNADLYPGPMHVSDEMVIYRYQLTW